VATALIHGRVGISEVDGLGDAAVRALSGRIAGMPARGPEERGAEHHGDQNRRPLCLRRNQRPDRLAAQAADGCSIRGEIPRLRAERGSALSDTSIDAALAAIGGQETLTDAGELMTPFTG
jgi:hypothetical protein